MFGKLAPCSGGPPIPLLKPKLVVGRHHSCDIPLCLPTVSARHCELELQEGYWHVRDLGSSNGTSVNGKKCEAGWLWPDDVLWLASYRYAIKYEAPPGKPPLKRGGAAIEETKPPRRETVPEEPDSRTLVRPRSMGTVSPSCLGKLLPCAGGPPIPLLKPKVIVGRHEGCDVVLSCAAVSSRHCQLEWSNGGWLISDLQSRNGIRVDGQRCEAQRLVSGNVLWIGGVRLEIVFTAQGPGPQPKGPAFAQSLLEKAGLSRQPLPAEEPRQRHSLEQDGSNDQ